MAIYATTRAHAVWPVPDISIVRIGLPPKSSEKFHPLVSSNVDPPKKTGAPESACATSSSLSPNVGDETARDQQIRVADPLLSLFRPGEQLHLRHAEWSTTWMAFRLVGFEYPEE